MDTIPTKKLPAIWLLLALWPIAFSGACTHAEEQSAENAIADKAIRASADDFVRAFDAGDAKKIAAQWTANGTLADESGRFFKGQTAIENEYATFFKQHPGARIEVTIESIQFPATNVAVEDGSATVTLNEGPSSAGRYTALHLLNDGKWQMTTVRESTVESSSNYERLQSLEWLIGKWQAKSDAASIVSDFHWIANKSFILRDYVVRHSGAATNSGVQIIGWDPQANRPRSWSFDATGGYGAGRWTAVSDGWQIESSGMLANGIPTTSREHLIRVPGENDVFGWRSTNRTAGNTPLADTDEVVLDRVVEKK